MTVRTKPEAILAPLTGRMAEAIDRDFDVLYQDLAALSSDLPTSCTIGGAYLYRVGGTDVSLADGGTGASLTALAGAVVYCTAAAFALTAAGASGQVLQSAGTGAPVWTTATYPATTTVSQLLYSSSANVVAGLASGNSSVLVTNGSGVPAWGTDIPTAVTIGSAYIYRAGGTDIPLLDGGTNASLSASHGAVVYSTATALGLTGVGTAGQVLQSAAAGSPTWTSDLLTSTTIGAAYIYRVSGTDVAVADGGTGLSSYAVGDILHATATGTLAGLADVAVGRVLVSGGVGVVPSWSTTPVLSGVTIGAQTLTEAMIAQLAATLGAALLHE